MFSRKSQADPQDQVVFCTDGQSTSAFATEYFRSHTVDSLWFVGVDSSPIYRNAEYVIGRDEARFQQHEQFFTHDVLAWVQNYLGIEHDRDRSAIFGYSCGGAFAASVGIRHPDLFQTVFAYSIAGRPVTSCDRQPDVDLSNSVFILRAGTREPEGMRKYMGRFGKWLMRAGARVDHHEEFGGHSFQLWSKALNNSIEAML